MPRGHPEPCVEARRSHGYGGTSKSYHTKTLCSHRLGSGETRADHTSTVRHTFRTSLTIRHARRHTGTHNHTFTIHHPRLPRNRNRGKSSVYVCLSRLTIGFQTLKSQYVPHIVTAIKLITQTDSGSQTIVSSKNVPPHGVRLGKNMGTI